MEFRECIPPFFFSILAELHTGTLTLTFTIEHCFTFVNVQT